MTADQGLALTLKATKLKKVKAWYIAESLERASCAHQYKYHKPSTSCHAAAAVVVAALVAVPHITTDRASVLESMCKHKLDACSACSNQGSYQQAAACYKLVAESIAKHCSQLKTLASTVPKQHNPAYIP